LDAASGNSSKRGAENPVQEIEVDHQYFQYTGKR
jgi:hypothetical protein